MPVSDIALTMEVGVGPKTAAYLISRYGTADNVFNTSLNDLVQDARLNENIAKNIVKKRFHKTAEKEIKFCRENGILPIPATSVMYPGLLKECNDYPHVIYYKGDTAALKNEMISMVGTRKITSYGQTACSKIVGGLPKYRKDITIVSGIAYGVDAAVHRAAIDNGIPTVVVSPVALPRITPVANGMLAEQIIKSGGGILSEYNSHNKDKGVNFLARNRIIAGLSIATVIVESPLKGGAVMTAGLADGYNRCVMAVPGRITDDRSEGTNHLIRINRAVMATSADDIARELCWDIPGGPFVSGNNGLPDLSPEALKIFGIIKDDSGISIDKLAVESGMDISVLAMILFDLEMDGFVKMIPGKRYEAI